MLKKIGAVLLALGLCLPYGCDVRPIIGVWAEAWSVLYLGVPVLVAVAYVLHTLVPPLAGLLERNGPALHGVLRAVFFLLAGAYLAGVVTEKPDSLPDRASTLIALVFSGALLYWEQRRGTKAQRLPLLLLVIVGLPAVGYLAGFLRSGGLQYGGWVVTVGYMLAVAGEMRGLREAPIITHSG